MGWLWNWRTEAKHLQILCTFLFTYLGWTSAVHNFYIFDKYLNCFQVGVSVIHGLLLSGAVIVRASKWECPLSESTCWAPVVMVSALWPWYNCTSWLGVKHEVNKSLLFLLIIPKHFEQNSANKIVDGTQLWNFVELSLTPPLMRKDETINLFLE